MEFDAEGYLRYKIPRQETPNLKTHFFDKLLTAHNAEIM